MRVIGSTLLVLVLAWPAPSAASPATEALAGLEAHYATRFDSGAAYWATAAALVVTGGVTLAFAAPGPNPFGLVSGTATILSGVSAAVSAWPLSRGPGLLADRRRARVGMEPERAAQEVLAEHAAWARDWRFVSTVATTVLLGSNAALLTTYAIRYEEQRITAAVVAGLYAIGIPFMLWFNSAPTREELAATAIGEAGSLRWQLQPMLAHAADRTSMGLAVAGGW